MQHTSEVYGVDVFDQLVFLKKKKLHEGKRMDFFFFLLREQLSFTSLALLWQVVTISLLGKIRPAAA